MTGASAGGLNAVLMAQAIRSRTPFAEFLPLWQDHADIDSLLKGPRHSTRYDAAAVLKGAYFKRCLREALDRPTSETPITQNLAVFASATLVRPNPIEFKDVPGAPIAETRSDAYFHITRRGPSQRGLDGFEPSDLVAGNVEALALVGRATSSLPGLFEPVVFERATFGSRLVGAFTRLRDEVEVMDGGVIDNVPISRAIRAIASSPTECRVRRVPLYLHPDPGARREPHADDDPTSALKVVQSFFGKRKETIREDIELLRQHNDAADRRREEGEALLRSFVTSGYRIDAAARAELAQSICAAMLLRAAIDPPSELPWHAPNVQRLVPLVDGPDDPSKAELARDIFATVSAPDVLVAVAARRIALGLQRIIGLVGPTAVEINFDEVQPRVYELLLLCDVITSFQVARFLGHGEGSAPTTRLTASRAELDEILVADAIDDRTWSALASWDLSAATPSPGGHHLVQHLELLVQRIIADCPMPTDDLRSPAAEVLRKLKSGETTPDDLDLALLPLAAEPVASDQTIEFVRIAGDVASPASLAFDKLAPARAGQDRRPAVASSRCLLPARLADQRLVVGSSRQCPRLAGRGARPRGDADAARQRLLGGERVHRCRSVRRRHQELVAGAPSARAARRTLRPATRFREGDDLRRVRGVGQSRSSAQRIAGNQRADEHGDSGCDHFIEDAATSSGQGGSDRVDGESPAAVGDCGCGACWSPCGRCDRVDALCDGSGQGEQHDRQLGTVDHRRASFPSALQHSWR